MPVNASFTVTSVPVISNTDTQASIKWSIVPNATYYIIYRDNIIIKQVDIRYEKNYTSYVDTSLNPETTYVYTVKAYDEYFRELDSSSTIVRTAKMLRPYGLSARCNLNTGEVALSWLINSLAADMTIIRKVNGPEIAVVYGNTNTYTFYVPLSEFYSGAQYEVISADFEGRRSDPSSPITLNITSIPTISASIKNGTVYVAFNSNMQVTTLILERSKYLNYSWSSWEQVATYTNPQSTVLQDTPKEPGTYRYRVYFSTGSHWGYTNITETLSVPGAPKNLNCMLESGNTIVLNWVNHIYNDSRLLVQRKVENGDYQTIAVLDSYATSYMDVSAFSINTTYTYRIAAYSNDECMAYSEEVSVYVGLPRAPYMLCVTALSNTALKLSWDDVSNNETGFIIEKKINSGEFTELVRLSANSTQYIDYNVSAGNIYTYRMKSINGYGLSESYSNEVMTSTSISTPSPLSFTATSVSSTQIDLTWAYPAGKNINTIIERKTGADGKWSTIAQLSAGVLKYSDTGLQPETQYFYRIKGAESAYIHSVTVPNDSGLEVLTMLESPSNLEAVAISSTSVELSWKDNCNENEFVIERKTASGTFTVVGYAPMNAVKWVDTGLNPNTRYTYRIKAKTYTNSSQYSDEVSVVTTILNQPLDLQATANPDNSITLKWKDNSNNETGFEIWRKTGANGAWEKHATVKRTEQYEDTGLQSNTQYTYKIRAYALLSQGGTVYSPFTPEVSAFTVSPQAPSRLAFTVLSPSMVQLSWKDNAIDEDNYIIERRTENTNKWTSIAVIPANSESYIDSGIEEYVIYYYRVIAYNRHYNSSAISEEIEIMTGVPDSPADLKAVPVSSSSVSLTWTDYSVNESGFIIERKSSGGVFVEIARTAAGITSFTDTGLQPSTNYVYRICAYNSSGKSGYSQESYVTTYDIATFDDIKDYTWAKEAIENLAGRGILPGRTIFAFAPGENITRAEFTSAIIKALGLSRTPIGSFNDVAVNHWAYKELMTAKIMGIISGDQDDNFYPDNPITRQDAAVITVNALKKAGKALPGYSVSILDRFSDKYLISSSALSSMASLVGENLLEEKGGGTISPIDPITRAEAAVLIYKLINR